MSSKSLSLESSSWNRTTTATNPFFHQQTLILSYSFCHLIKPKQTKGQVTLTMCLIVSLFILSPKYNALLRNSFKKKRSFLKTIKKFFNFFILIWKILDQACLFLSNFPNDFQFLDSKLIMSCESETQMAVCAFHITDKINERTAVLHKLLGQSWGVWPFLITCLVPLCVCVCVCVWSQWP